jgi:Mg2+ and Co2+ transporter CorA
MFSVIFLPATLIASIWGMNVGGLIAAVFASVAIVLFRFRFF